MNELAVILGWLGVYAPVGLGALGSAIGVAMLPRGVPVEIEFVFALKES